MLASGVCALLSLGFVALRGVLLHRCAIESGIAATWWESVRGFCEGACVELVSWPGKAWADAYRQWLWMPAALTTRLRAIVTFRVCTAIGGVLLLAIATMVVAQENWQIAAIAGVALFAAGAGVWRKVRKARTGGIVVRTGSLVGVALLASGLDVMSAAMVAWIIAGVAPVDFGAIFVLIALASAASTVPLGAGVLDAGAWYALTAHFGVPTGEALICVATYRICGPGLTLLLGAGSGAVRWLGSTPAERVVRGRKSSLPFALQDVPTGTIGEVVPTALSLGCSASASVTPLQGSVDTANKARRAA